MSEKIRYLQFALLLSVIGIGFSLLSGCGDDSITPPKSAESMLSAQRNSGTQSQQDDSTRDTNRPAGGSSELYAGWKNPQDILVFTGRQFGYVEPCGCTGLERQKGGLARRYSFIRGLQNQQGWNVVSVDTGNQVRRFGRQPELKFNLTSELLERMGYCLVLVLLLRS